MPTTTDLWSDVENTIGQAILVAWDECHKIYLAMDDTEANWFRCCYNTYVQDTPEVMLATVKKWYADSCGLRFVQSVTNNPDDPNSGYVTLIEQGDQRDPDNWDDDDDDDYDEEDN